MVRAACHCTAIRLEIAELLDWVLDCNCTLSRGSRDGIYGER